MYARHGDNGLADEDKQTDGKAVNEKLKSLKEYRKFVSELVKHNDIKEIVEQDYSCIFKKKTPADCES